MKLIRIFLVCLFAALPHFMQAQDSLYIMKNGLVDFKQALSEIDSMSFVNTLYPSLSDVIAKDSNFTLFSEAMEITGYANLIRNTPEEDENYYPENCIWAIKTYNIKEEIPQHRKIGFTVLMESDSMLANYKECPLCPDGVKTIEDLNNLAKYYYSSSYNGIFSDGVGVDNPKDPRNYLNRFIAYHCMNRMLISSRFINDYETPNQIKTFDAYEYKETMLSNTLIKVKKDRDYHLTFFLNMWNEADITTGIQFTKDIDNDAMNGYYHAIDKPLVYSRNVDSTISSNRMRMDAASFFREFATNNMRGNNPTAENMAGKAHRYIIPQGYCDNMSFTSTTRMTYLGANGIYEDFEGDEIYVEGKYDFTITTLPIPAGTYEVRFGYQPTSWRGLDQIYFDSVTCGPPVKFYLLANNPLIGWESPGSKANDPNGYANDILLRTRGYMKGPSSFKCSIGLYYDPNKTARQSNSTLRKIVGTFTFAEPGKHTLRIQNTGSSGGDVQFMLDYLEFVPVSILKNEGVD